MTACGKTENPSSTFTPSITSPSVATGTEKTKVIQIGFPTAPDPSDSNFILATEMKRIIDERSNGSLLLELFPNGQLGQEREMFEGMQMGTVDMGIFTNAYVSNFISASRVFDLPFLISDYETAYKVSRGPVGKAVFDSFESSGVIPLSHGCGGLRHLISNTKPVRAPGDLKGMKIRCMENKMYLDTYAALGTNAVPMAYSETIPALQQKTIEGMDGTASNLYTGGYAEICEYLSLTGHFFSYTNVCISESLWKTLNAEQQTLIKDAAIEASDFQFAFAKKNDEEMVDKMEGDGMTIVRDIDYAAFRKALEYFYEDQKDIIGGTYVEDILSEIAKM